MNYVLIGVCAVSIVLNIALVSYNHRVVHWANYWKLEALRAQGDMRKLCIDMENLYKVIFEGGGQDDRQGVESASVSEG